MLPKGALHCFVAGYEKGETQVFEYDLAKQGRIHHQSARTGKPSFTVPKEESDLTAIFVIEVSKNFRKHRNSICKRKSYPYGDKHIFP